MACGDKYRDQMLRTATGRTPDDPCTLPPRFCLPGEYDSWYRVAERIAQEVKTRWDALSLAESRSGDARFSEALQNRVTQYQAGFSELPRRSWEEIFTSDQELIERAIQNGEEGVCLMELLDDAIEEAGGSPVATAGRGDGDGMPTWGWILIGVGTAGAGYLIARKWAREEVRFGE